MKQLFSNGMEAEHWMYNNCEKCWKASHLKRDETYTQSHCRHHNEIIQAWIGDGTGSDATYQITGKARCPKLETQRPTRKQRQTDKYKDYPTLF